MKNKLVISLLAILAIVLVVFIFTLTSGKLESKDKFEKEVTRVEMVSKSDEVSDIEKDLQDTDLSNLDGEMLQIEKELNI